jgi:hypothetical protein
MVRDTLSYYPCSCSIYIVYNGIYPDVGFFLRSSKGALIEIVD